MNACPNTLFAPGRLWSLWAMFEFRASQFYRVAEWLTTIQSSVDKYEGASAYDRPLDELEDGLRERMVTSATTVQKDFSNLPIPVASLTLGDLIAAVSNPKCTVRELGASAQEVGRTLTRELSLLKFYGISPDRARYLNRSEFGQDVLDRFPSALDDIEDAGRCLALGQGTATVFHLMRVMEAGLRALSSAIGIPYAPSWESHLTQIAARIAAKHPSKGIEWKTDEPFFRDVSGDLQTVKQAWRNPTMHIVRRYSADEAEDVFRAVKAFMKRLSSRLGEVRQSF